LALDGERERKSSQPMAARSLDFGTSSLHGLFEASGSIAIDKIFRRLALQERAPLGRER
jgi:hypothetical protein